MISLVLFMFYLMAIFQFDPLVALSLILCCFFLFAVKFHGLAYTIFGEGDPAATYTASPSEFMN